MYTNIRVIIDTLNGPLVESDVTGVWFIILNKFFPPEEGYIICPEAWVGVKKPDLIVVKKGEAHVLYVECKSDQHLNNVGLSQIGGQLMEQCQQTPNRSGIIYGLAAVGRYCKFYKYTRGIKTIFQEMHTGMYDDLRDSEYILHILSIVKQQSHN